MNSVELDRRTLLTSLAGGLLQKVLSNLNSLKGRVVRVNKRNRTLQVVLEQANSLQKNLRDLVQGALDTEGELGYDDVEKIPSGGNNLPNNQPNKPVNKPVSDWKAVFVPSNGVILRSVKFAGGSETEKIGWIAGEGGTLLYTLDGVKWQVLQTTPQQKAQLKGVAFYSIFPDGRNCWIVGSKGTIVRVSYRD